MSEAIKRARRANGAHLSPLAASLLVKARSRWVFCFGCLAESGRTGHGRPAVMMIKGACWPRPPRRVFKRDGQTCAADMLVGGVSTFILANKEQQKVKAPSAHTSDSHRPHDSATALTVAPRRELRLPSFHPPFL